jgi:hypothetical protein
MRNPAALAAATKKPTKKTTAEQLIEQFRMTSIVSETR